MPGKFSSSEYISKNNVLSIGHVIVNIGIITSINWSQVWTDDIFPEKRQVKHHVTGHFRYHAYQPFSYTIFIIFIEQKIKNALIIIKNVPNKTMRFESPLLSI